MFPLKKTEKEYDSLVEAYRAEVARLIARTEPCALSRFRAAGRIFGQDAETLGLR